MSMNMFHLDSDELKKMRPCPACKRRDHLRILQGFGAQVYCEKCCVEGPEVPGHRFEDERRDGIAAWNEDVDKTMATRESRRAFKAMLASRGKKEKA